MIIASHSSSYSHNVDKNILTITTVKSRRQQTAKVIRGLTTTTNLTLLLIT